MDRASRTALWRQVAAALGLAPAGRHGEAMAYEARLGAMPVIVRSHLTAPEGAFEVEVRSPVRQDLPWLLVPRSTLLHEPEVRTGDVAFDDAVGIAEGGEEALIRLRRRARAAVADAIATGAVLYGTTARLSAAAAAALDTPDRIVAAIEAMGQAIDAIGGETLAILIDGYRSPSGAPAVDRAIDRRLEGSLHDLAPEPLSAAVQIIVQRAPDLLALLKGTPDQQSVIAAWADLDPDDPRLIDHATAVWRAFRTPAVVDLAAALLRRHGPNGAFERLWALPAIASSEHAIDRLLAAADARPGGECDAVYLGLKAVPPSRCEAVADRIRHIADPLALYRLLELARAHPDALAPILVDRVVEAIETDRTHEITAIARHAQGAPPLAEALFARAAETARAIAFLRPNTDTLRLSQIDAIAHERGEPTDEALLHWLDVGSLQVRIAAAQALGTAGSGRALPALDDLAGKRFGPAELRETARTAAAAIRARPGTGALALADTLGGGLSPSDPE